MVRSRLGLEVLTLAEALKRLRYKEPMALV